MKFNATYKAIMESDEKSTKEVVSNGTVFWRNKNGQLHRLDGPAIERASGTKEWWVNGKELTEEEFNVEYRKLGEKHGNSSR